MSAVPERPFPRSARVRNRSPIASHPPLAVAPLRDRERESCRIVGSRRIILAHVRIGFRHIPQAILKLMPLTLGPTLMAATLLHSSIASRVFPLDGAAGKYHFSGTSSCSPLRASRWGPYSLDRKLVLGAVAGRSKGSSLSWLMAAVAEG